MFVTALMIAALLSGLYFSTEKLLNVRQSLRDEGEDVSVYL